MQPNLVRQNPNVIVPVMEQSIPKPAPKPAPIVQPPREIRPDPNPIIPVMEDNPRVAHAFRRLGNMYQVGGLVWSAIAPKPAKILTGFGVYWR